MSGVRVPVAALAAVLAIGATGVAGARQPWGTDDRQPPPPAESTLWGQPFDARYVFALTRELTDSTASPAAVACGAPLTLVVDVALLPVALALGFLD